jgi:hypothetical protein
MPAGSPLSFVIPQPAQPQKSTSSRSLRDRAAKGTIGFSFSSSIGRWISKLGLPFSSLAANRAPRIVNDKGR